MTGPFIYGISAVDIDPGCPVDILYLVFQSCPPDTTPAVSYCNFPGDRNKRAGKSRIVETRHGDVPIRLLVPEGVTLAGEDAHVRFDPAHTQVYADGWMVEAAS